MSKYALQNADLALFTVLWNQYQGRTTPEIHLRIAGWLEYAWKNGDRRLLLMAFRSSGKSTMIGVFSAWLLYRNPNLRIMVLAADHMLAKKMVSNVKHILERHPLTSHLRPDKPEQWAGDRFTVRRDMVLRDPSMLAKGVSSNITGSRADIIICDDVEVPNTCDTPGKRTDLRERLAEIDYVLADGHGLQLYVGTPHSYYTIYAKRARTEIGEEAAFLQGFKRLEIPLLKDGQSIWPECYGDAAIAQIKRQSGPNKFASQMMLEPKNIADGRLDPSLLQIYDEDIDYTKELQTLFLGQRKLVSASAWWDPAFGAAGGDRSAMAVIYGDADGNLYLHHLAYIKVEAHDKTDEATQQCQAVSGVAKDCFLPSLAVETNGIGKFLPAILRNELARAKVPCRVQEMTSTRAKDLRILEAFDAVMAARRLFVHRAVLSTPFASEMQEWQPGKKRGHDDGLDAVAGALSLQPVRLHRLYGTGSFAWMKGAQTRKAKTDFEI